MGVFATVEKALTFFSFPPSLCLCVGVDVSVQFTWALIFWLW